MYANDLDTSFTTSTGRWYQYVFTYNTGNNVKQVYRNATLANQGAGSPYSGVGTIRIGATYSAGSNFASGFFGNIKLYNRILDVNEIINNFNALKGRYGLS
jgi:hypothetical protein